MQPQISQFQWRRTPFMPMMMVFAASIIALFIFRTFPDLDILVSRLFIVDRPCKETTLIVCGYYPLAHDPTLRHMRSFSLFLPYFMSTLVVFYLVYLIGINRKTTVTELKKPSLVIWTLLLATLGLVNLILKGFWGRPRPYQVEGLGGDQPFVLPGTISDYCASNCSFVSGEASGATWLFTFLVFLDKRWRWPIGILTGLYLIFFGGLRIAFGRHFLSDVIMSWLFTLCVFASLQYLFSTPAVTAKFDKLAKWSNQFTNNWRKKAH